jgi:hypothetical protein
VRLERLVDYLEGKGDKDGERGDKGRMGEET